MKLTQCFTPPIIENVKHLFKLKEILSFCCNLRVAYRVDVMTSSCETETRQKSALCVPNKAGKVQRMLTLHITCCGAGESPLAGGSFSTACFSSHPCVALQLFLL